MIPLQGRCGQRVGRSIALLFHGRGTRREWVVSSTPRPQFNPVKDPVPILQEARWAPGPVLTGGKSCPHRDSIPDSPACSQSLYRLSYRAHTEKWRCTQTVSVTERLGISIMKQACEVRTVHTAILQKRENVYQPHSNNIHQLYNNVLSYHILHRIISHHIKSKLVGRIAQSV